jgi:O-antigen biosynthesis protein
MYATCRRWIDYRDMTAVKPKPDMPSDVIIADELQIELSNRVETLERSLQEELSKRSSVEFELYQIKNSLAWKILLNYKSFRDKLFAEGTLRLACYELVRDFCKVLLLKDQATDSSSRRLSRLIAKAFWIVRSEGLASLRRQLRNEIESKNEYSEWIEKYDTLTDADRAAISRHIDQLSYKPLISIVMPVRNTPGNWLRLAIESVRRQLYSNWELCVADDASVASAVTRILEEYSANDSRIKVILRKNKGHISAASNTAIDLAAGEFVAFLDHDDELSEHALYMVAVELNANRDADLIYSDQDKINEAGQRYDPYFKPDWNPVLFLAQNFICHLAVYRTCIIRELGGLRLGYEGAQDWDLAMRVSERVPASRIRHIPHVLYHWRAVEGSTARGDEQKQYARAAQQRTLESHFQRIGRKVGVLPAVDPYWRIKHSLPDPPPRVTLIIPTRNGFELLNRCLESIFKKTIYRNYEVIIVDNQSDDPKLLDYLAELERERRVRVLRYDAPFNYAAMNNLAVQNASGEIIGLLNNDLEVITPGWLEEMVSHAVQPEIGAVGAMLYYPNDTIQHAGVILGIGFPSPGVAGHAYKNFPRGYRGQSSRALLCQNLSAVTAACLVVRRRLFEDVAGLEEKKLPIAFNDVDFCLRLAERGYRNVWTPYAEVYHYESASRGYENTPEKLERFEIESRYMKQRWQELLVSDPAYNLNLAIGREPFMLSFPPRITKPWVEVGLNRNYSVGRHRVTNV